MDKITTLKEGWAYFLEVFRNVIPPGEEYKFQGAYYAGAATYDSILFNRIKKAAEGKEEDDAIHLNITDHIFNLHEEVGSFAKKRVGECEERINEGNARN